MNETNHKHHTQHQVSLSDLHKRRGQELDGRVHNTWNDCAKCPLGNILSFTAARIISKDADESTGRKESQQTECFDIVSPNNTKRLLNIQSLEPTSHS